MGLVLMLTSQSKKLQLFRLTCNSVIVKQQTYSCRFTLANKSQKLGCTLHVGECLNPSLQKVLK